LINILKLTSGDEIICNIENEDRFQLKAELPVKIISQVDVQAEEFMFLLLDWIPFSDSGHAMVNLDKIIARYKPSDKILEQYKERLLSMVGEIDYDEEEYISMKSKYGSGMH
jgi:hypothetical protein